MPKVRTLMEVSPRNIPPSLFEIEIGRSRVLREGWFKWFWLGDTVKGELILIGPFRSKRSALRAWDLVGETYVAWNLQQQRLFQAMGLGAEYEQYQKKTNSEEVQQQEDGHQAETRSWFIGCRQAGGKTDE